MAVRMLCLILVIFTFKSATCNDDFWYSYQLDSGYGNREELAIKNVKSVDTFKIDEPVIKWMSLSLRHKSYALGLTENGVTMLEAVLDSNDEKNFVVNSSYTPMNGSVLDAHLFEYRNSKQFKSEIIAIIVIRNDRSENNFVDLKWFKLTDSNKLINIWKWDLQKKVNHINVFKIDESYHILVCNEGSKNYTTADLYEFILGDNQDYWLNQKIVLETSPRSSAINYYGEDMYLSLPQQNSVRVYKLDENHFVPYKNLSAGNVNHITSFKVGFQAFLTIDGYNAGIYEFTSDGFSKEDIVDANLNGVDYWLSIPIRTYRDEEILIAERSLDHTSHKSFVIEVVLYNGGKFMVHDEMTCEYYGEIFNGMNCLVEEENTPGVKGSAVLAVGNTLGVIIPGKQGSSKLIMINKEMKQLSSPFKKQLEVLKKLKDDLQGKIDKEKLLSEPDRPTKKLLIENRTGILNEPLSRQVESQTTLKQIHNVDLSDGENKLKEMWGKINRIRETLDDLNAKLKSYVPNEARGTVLKNLIVDGSLEVYGNSNIRNIETPDFNDGFDFSDIVRLDNMKPIPSHKTFLDVDVESINFNTVNDIPSIDIAFKNIDPVKIVGDIVFKNTISIAGNLAAEMINGVVLEDEIIQTGNAYNDTINFAHLNTSGSIGVKLANKFPIHENYSDAIQHDDKMENIETIEFDTLYIPGNLSVVTVNGENLDSTISSLCMTNIQTYVPGGTRILGEVTVTNKLTIAKLNNLKYPEEYVLSKSEKFRKITGKKSFTSSVEVKKLTTTGKVNSVDTNDLITLSSNQTLTGNVTFQDLDVTEGFKVNGSSIHSHINDILPNPTLLQSHLISSNVNFNTLEVNGLITIGNDFNGTNLHGYLDDVVYKTKESEDISSVKAFSNGLTVRKNLILESNTINENPLELFVHKEMPQIMVSQTLNGNVSFENLALKGSIGGINISQIYHETVKLSGDQFMQSQLIFENDIIANDLEIVESLNDVDHSDYLYINGNRLMKKVYFDKIKANNLEIRGNLSSQINNFNLTDFENKRLSYTKDQAITADFHLKTSKIHNLKPVLLNNYTFTQLFNMEYYAEKVREMIEAVNVKINEMHVKGSLNISKIDGLPMEHVFENCMATKDTKRRKEMTLLERVDFRAMEVEFFNDIPIFEFSKNIIYKNQTDNLIINTPKIYIHGYEVKNYISSPLVNSVPVENVLRKGEEQTIFSPILIMGNVLLNSDCTIAGNIGKVPIEYFKESFRRINESTYQLNGDAEFSRFTYIDDLYIKGFANNKNVNALLNNLVNINEDVELTGAITFKQGVDIENNLSINSKINDIDLDTFKDNVVLITQDGPVEGVVSFNEDVIITEGLHVDIGLQSPVVMGVLLEELINNSVFLNNGKILGTIIFDEAVVRSELKTAMLNKIDVDTLIPLRTNQEIEKQLHFMKLSSFNDIVVDNLINGHKLASELHNSVLSGRIQKITSGVIFDGNVLVRRFLDINGLINGHDFTKIVTTDTKQHLHALYEFSNKTTITGLMNVSGLINGFNISEWAATGIKKASKEIQTINNHWTVNNTIFRKNVLSTDSINGLDLRAVAFSVEDRRIFKDAIESQLLDQFQTICKDINGIIATSKKQIYLFDYLDNYQHKDFASNVETVHQFQYQNLNYLLVTEENRCTSSLFVWSKNSFTFVRELETGRISQIITVRDGDFLFLVSRSLHERSSCDFEGTNVWHFSADNIMLLYKIENYALLEESLLPGTFYAAAAEEVVEFRLISTTETNIYKTRKWGVNTDNAVFIPRGFKSGIALSNGRNLIKLSRDEPVVLEQFGEDYNAITLSNVTWSNNNYLRGRLDGEVLIMKVGYPRRKVLTAVASHEGTSIKGKLDMIKIYDDPMSGSMFHKVPCYKPSSLLSVEFGENGETLLVFLENNSILQVYEYKGIEGFIHRTTVYMKGSKLVQFVLPLGDTQKAHNFVGVVNKNRLSLLQAVMEGDQVLDDNLECTL